MFRLLKHGVHRIRQLRADLEAAAKAGFTVPAATKECMKYLVFMTLFSLTLFVNRPNEDVYFMVRNVRELVLNQYLSFSTYPFQKGFGQVIELKDAMRWVHDVLVPIVYESRVAGAPEATIIGANFLLGGIRLRQVRVKTIPCQSHPPGLNISECLPQYETQYEASESFGPNGDFFWSQKGNYPFEYWGQVATYPGSGYIEDLGSDGVAAKARIERLIALNWVDLRTRLIVADVPMYNANIGYFVGMTYLMEFPAGGGMVGSNVFRAVKLYRYETSMDYFVLVIEILFVLMLLYYLFDEFRNVCRNGVRRHFSSAWNILDWVNMTLLFVVLALRITWLKSLSEKEFSNDAFVEIHDIIFLSRQEVNINSFNAFCIFFKTFKYLGMVPRMNQLFRTLGNASTDLFLFFVMFFIVYSGFTAAFYLTYSLEVFEYRTVAQTMQSLLRFLLGDFDFYVLYKSNRVLTPMLFFSYVLFCLYMLLNMFLAILNDSYAEVKEEDSKNPPPDIIASIRKRAEAFTSFLRQRQRQAKMASQAIAMGDKDGDGTIDKAELEEVIAGNQSKFQGLIKDMDGDGKVSAQEVLAQFDKDGDGMIDESELNTIKRKLAEAAHDAASKDVEALITAEPSVQDAAAADESEDEQQDQNLDSNTFVDQAVRPEDLEEMRQMTLTMMEKLNVLTEYILNSPAEVIAAKQLSEVSSRLDKMSTLLTAASAY